MTAPDAHVVVVGASLAGPRAAESLRRHGFAGRITLVGAEDHFPPVDRPPLSKSALSWTGDEPPLLERIRVKPTLDADMLLWAAGSGITPVMSILKSALTAGTGRVVLCYANRDERSVIFAAELRELAARYAGRLTVLHWLESVQGLPSRAQLVGFARLFPGYHSYICGPGPFMDAVRAALTEAGTPHQHIHQEVFQSLTGDPFAETPPVEIADDSDAAEAEVSLDGQVHRLRWPRDRNLVDVMLAAGIEVPYSCREGSCGSCAATVLDGEIDRGDTPILEPADIADGLFLACQARPVSDTVRVEF